MVNYNNYITKEPIRKYPLKSTSLNAFRKICAVINHEPFTFAPHKDGKPYATEYYLTNEGLEILYDFTKNHTLQYMRSILSIFFIRATDYDVQHPETFSFFANFRGTTGMRKKQGSVQKALVEHQVGRTLRKYNFDSIAEAREYIKVLLLTYPIEDITLYRVRPRVGREKIKTYVEPHHTIEEYNRRRHDSSRNL